MQNLSDAAFYGLDNLQQLYLDGNVITGVERRWLYGLRSLKTLNLSGNQIENIEDNCWEYMNQLHSLDLSWNLVNRLSKSKTEGLQRLRTLNLSYNKISFLSPDTFQPLHNLERLDLSYNHLSWAIEDVPAPFKGLVDCESINLAGNQLRTLHIEALSGLSTLKVLNISDNPLKWLSPQTFVGFPSLNLHISNVTTFVCDCHSTWLLSFLRSSATKKLREQGKKVKSSPSCRYPAALNGRALIELSLQDLVCTENAIRPQFTVHPEKRTLLMKGNGSLLCQVEAHPETTTRVEWRKDYRPLSPQILKGLETTERVFEKIFEINSTLHFTNISWGDAGSYQCVAENDFGIVYSSQANVTVHVYPSFVKQPMNVTVRLGSNAKLECSAKGHPLPEITVQKEGGENFAAALERRFHVMPNEDSFIILDVKLIDMGSYCCSAKNIAGEIRACASVTVYETPNFSTKLRDEKVMEGGSTILECLSTGSPAPHITWSKDNVVVHVGKEESRIRLKENGSLLIIRDVRLTDAGRYECILSNAVGTARDFLVLNVVPVGNTDVISAWAPSLVLSALIVIAVAFVVSSLVAWLLTVFRDKQSPVSNSNQPTFGGELPSLYSPLTPTIVLPPDDGSQSSAKDSGTGDEVLVDDSQGLLCDDPYNYNNGDDLWARREFETFSTFGSTNGRPRGPGLRKVEIPLPPSKTCTEERMLESSNDGSMSMLAPPSKDRTDGDGSCCKGDIEEIRPSSIEGRNEVTTRSSITTAV